MAKYDSLADRIIAMSVHEQDGCWIWLGARLKSGYGRINVWTPGGEHFSTLAHRASWQAFRRADHYERDIHHVCRNRACVNPAHLAVVTHKQNCANGMRKNGTNGAQRGKNGAFKKALDKA